MGQVSLRGKFGLSCVFWVKPGQSGPTTWGMWEISSYARSRTVQFSVKIEWDEANGSKDLKGFCFYRSE